MLFLRLYVLYNKGRRPSLRMLSAGALDRGEAKNAVIEVNETKGQSVKTEYINIPLQFSGSLFNTLRYLFIK